MPLYYFDVIDATERDVDNLGIELPNADAARQEALLALARMCEETVLTDRERERCEAALRVREEARELFIVRISASVERRSIGR